jgi:phosphoserine phosphatase
VRAAIGETQEPHLTSGRAVAAWRERALTEQDYFAEMLEELAPLLGDLPRGTSQEIVRSLTAIARLLDELDAARSELERKLALIEAEQIIAGR